MDEAMKEVIVIFGKQRYLFKKIYADDLVIVTKEKNLPAFIEAAKISF